jgi:hypothetical protein
MRHKSAKMPAEIRTKNVSGTDNIVEECVVTALTWKTSQPTHRNARTHPKPSFK